MIPLRVTILAAALAAVPAAGERPTQPVPVIDGERLDRAIASAIRFLESTVGADGMCKGDFPASSLQYGGQTSACAYALVSAGADPRKDATARALDWLAKAELKSTYAVAMRACALSGVRDDRVLPALRKDTQWLLRAAGADGAYTYTPRGGATGDTYDNSNTHMAVLAVWAAARRGVEVPQEYWRVIERHWINDQQTDGGWGYFVRPGAITNKTYGSMTAAGLATLFACFDNLHARQFIRCAATSDTKPIEEAFAWLAKHYSAAENPRLGPNRYHYWLFALERVGLASGRKRFGDHDWFAEAAARLLETQNADGSWGYGERIPETAFALIFLVRGRDPVLANKLQFTGRWNARPRDLANFTRFVGHEFERPVSWQIVRADVDADDLDDAPLLYLSGAGPIELTDAEVSALRRFALRGGLIVSEAACNNGSFTLDMQNLYTRMFPEFPLRRLRDDHPVYSANFKVKDFAGLSGVSNGVRLLAVHSPRELSLALQLGPDATQRPVFEVMANLYMFATDKGHLRPRGARLWPAEATFQPVATIRLARIKHKGNCDPEPLAFDRLARILARDRRVRLEVSEPMDPAALDASQWPVAHMTGTEAFTLSEAESVALREYLAAGGTILADAAGGSAPFAESVRKHIFPLAGGQFGGTLSSQHPVYRRPFAMEKVAYRRTLALALGEGKTTPRLHGEQLGGRIAVFFSPDDLTAGLVGYPQLGLLGYSPQSAVELMTNMLFYAARIGPRAEEEVVTEIRILPVK